MAFLDKTRKRVYQHEWYVQNRVRLGKKERIPQTPEEMRLIRLMYAQLKYLATREQRLARDKIRYSKNKSTYRIRAHAYYVKHREATQARTARYKKAHPDIYVKSSADWKLNNPELVAADHALRRKAVLLACPSWADMLSIGKVYEKARIKSAKTGVKHVADHFYPIRHKLLCGLHVSWNLRVITANANGHKSNKVAADMLSMSFTR